MLNISSQNVNFNGESVISSVDENDQTVDIQVGVMDANYSGDTIYFNFSIVDREVYAANKTAVDKDFADFRDQVVEIINAM